MNVCENVIVGARLFPDKCAIVSGSQQLTYRRLEELSGRAARVLLEMGVERGDRVGIVIPNTLAFPVWYYAALRIGAIAVAASTRLASEEIAFILSDCEAKVAVATPDLLETVRCDAPRCVRHIVSAVEDGDQFDDRPLDTCESIGTGVYVNGDPQEPAVILYTSGTTGFPKGATLSHQNVRSTMHNHNHHCQMRADDCLLLAVPLFHCYGQNSLLNAGLNVGTTLVLQRGFDLNESKRLIRDHGVTKLFGVPTTFQLMLESCEPADLASIDYCFSAAATLPVQLTKGWIEKFGMPIYEGYGLTETAPFACYNHRIKYVPGSLGMPVDLVEMKVVDPETGEECPVGTPGEIAIRGPNVMLGYWNRPDETAAAIRDGWFYSGDIGQMDQQGYYYIVDRLKDMISIGGVKVFPAEVERVLRDHPTVVDAAVVGFPDAVLGEKVVAFIVPPEGLEPSAEEIQDYCHARMASFKTPSRIQVVESLPRNPAGKVLKTKLREFEFSENNTSLANNRRGRVPPVVGPVSDSGSAAVSLDPPLIQRLRATHAASRVGMVTSMLQDLVSEMTGVKGAAAADALFLESGMDSLMIVEMRDRLQADVGKSLDLPATMVFDHPRICDLAAHLVTSIEERMASGTNQQPRPTSPLKPDPGADSEMVDGIEEMSEQEALRALMREMNE